MKMRFLRVVLLVAGASFQVGEGFLVGGRRPPVSPRVFGKPGAGDEEGPLVRAAWVAAEALGKAAAVFSRDGDDAGEATGRGDAVDVPARTVGEVVERLRRDYERNYFVTGSMDCGLYAEDCTFGDPFASFQGRDRFVENLANLALFVTRAEIRSLGFEVFEGADATRPVNRDGRGSPLSVRTRQMVKVQLRLPWKPVLAWVWGVTHVFEESGGALLCVEHWESWEIGAAAGVAQVFRKGPENALPGGFAP